MGVRIFFAYSSMGGPSGMTYADLIGLFKLKRLIVIIGGGSNTANQHALKRGTIEAKPK
jgi:hypothetical protein